jgi:long-chain acyl-CoA synthetase
MANHLLTVNHELDPHEQLAVLILMSQPWTVENGLITPTFKIKRNVLETRYESHFDRWTSSGRKVVWAD